MANLFISLTLGQWMYRGYNAGEGNWFHFGMRRGNLCAYLLTQEIAWPPAVASCRRLEGCYPSVWRIVFSGSFAAGQQSKLGLVMHTLPIKLDDQSAETGGFLSRSVNLEFVTQPFMDTPAHIEVFGCERFVTRAEQLV
ncbi:hypothetical protein ATY75_21960 [Rhizobium sp. N122]|nr:hypothetical protein ATY75_21960 [Rhizobium sp. N122]